MRVFIGNYRGIMFNKSFLYSVLFLFASVFSAHLLSTDIIQDSFVLCVKVMGVGTFDIEMARSNFTLQAFEEALRKKEVEFEELVVIHAGKKLDEISFSAIKERHKSGEDIHVVPKSTADRLLAPKKKENSLEELARRLPVLKWKPHIEQRGLSILEDPMVPTSVQRLNEKFPEYNGQYIPGTERSEIFKNFFIAEGLGTLMALLEEYKTKPSILDFSCDPRIKALAEERFADYEQICILDNHTAFPNLLQAFEASQLEQKIDRALLGGKDVMISCQMGQSRSVSIAIVYLMKKFKLSVFQAFQVIKNGRPTAQPNAGFLSGLLEFESTFSNIHPDLDPSLAEEWRQAIQNSPLRYLDKFEITSSTEGNPIFGSRGDEANLWDLLTVFKLAQVKIISIKALNNLKLELTFSEDFSVVLSKVDEYLYPQNSTYEVR